MRQGKINVYLHIGTHKTGTTAIQNFVFMNSEKLLSKGFLYPKSGRPRSSPKGHHNLAWSVRKDKRYDPLVGSWEEIQQEIDALNPDNVVLSSEDFEIKDFDLVALVKSYLERYRTKIIVYLRRQDDFFQSVYTQNVKNNCLSLNIHKFIQIIKYRGDYYELLKPWRDIFGKENIIVRIYEKEKFANGNLYADFMSSVGINTDEKYEQPKGFINFSPEPKIVELIRSLNEIVGKGQFYFSKQDCINLYVKPLLANYNGERTINNDTILSAEERIDIINEFKASNQKVAQEYLGQENLFQAKLTARNGLGGGRSEFNHKKLRELLLKLEEQSEDHRLRQLIDFLDSNPVFFTSQEKGVAEYIDEGIKLKKEGNLASAIEKLSKALQLEPNSISVLNHLAEIYQSKKEFYQSITYYKQVIQLQPANGIAHARLAQVMMAQKNTQEAITLYQKALALQPEQPVWVYVGLGDALNQNGAVEDAIAAYQKAIEIKPDKSRVYARLAQAMMAQKNTQEAITLYQKALALQPEQPVWVYVGLGDAFNQNGQSDEAIAAYQKAIEIKPDKHQLYLSLAHLYQTKGDLDTAIDIYKKIIKSQEDLTPSICRSIEEVFRLQELANKSTTVTKSALSLTTLTPEESLIASVSGFKDEGDIVYHSLAWQYSIGIRRFVILDNMSSDNTVQQIKRFAAEYQKAIVYLIEDSEIRHYQSQKMTAAAEFAYKLWQTEWIFPFDADECLCSSHKPLHKVLENIPKDKLCISIPLRDHVLTPLDETYETNPLKRIRYREKPNSKQKPVVKVIVRWKPGMVITQGNHEVFLNGELVDSLNGEELGLFIRHYPWRSKEHLKRKILNGGRAHQSDPDIPGTFRWRKPYILYKLGHEEYLDELYASKIRNPDDCIYDPAIP